MRFFRLLSFFFITILILNSCDHENKEALSTEESKLENNSATDDSTIYRTCIYDIKINYPLPGEISPDEIKIYIRSSDTSLNNVLNSKLIDEILFQRGSDSTINEDRSGLSLRIAEVKPNFYELSYMTSHFIFNPIDTVKEGSDFIQTAKMLITSKNGRRWEIKTCPQVL